MESGVYISKEQLEKCGWKFSFNVDNLEVWEQAKEFLFYDSKTGRILRIIQKFYNS